MKRGEMAQYKMIDRKPIYPNNQYNSQVRFSTIGLISTSIAKI